jgi:hypothetical protein
MAEDKLRTSTQNRAMHLYFNHLAEELNNCGLDMRRTLKPGIDIPWSGKTVKEYLWRPVMQSQLGIESTTMLTTKDIDKVFETLTRHLGMKFGLIVDFPSIETQINKLRTEEEK